MDAPDWRRDGHDWPNRHASRFIRAAGLSWHVQILGSGPVALLLHGTAASTHSWRDVAPLLAEHFTVVAPDLPGHGFTQAPVPSRLSLPGMAQSVSGLMHALGFAPGLAIGHSAGAAILARMCLDGGIDPALLVSLNGAFTPYRQENHAWYSGLARLMFVNPLVPRLFSAFAADRPRIERLLRNTGSVPDEAGVIFYHRLVRRPAHVAAALGMMAHFDLVPLMREIPKLKPKLILVAGEKDRAVPPDQADAVRQRVPGAVVERMAGLGHLSHEEAPAETVALIVRAARAAGLLPAT